MMGEFWLMLLGTDERKQRTWIKPLVNQMGATTATGTRIAALLLYGRVAKIAIDIVRCSMIARIEAPRAQK